VKKLQGMPRRVSDYPDAFTGWNFISSIGSIISVAATVLFLQIVYLQLVKGKAVFGYPWAVPQLFSDYLRILKDKTAPGLEWALDNPPKPHAFTSLPLQSSSGSGGPEKPKNNSKNEEDSDPDKDMEVDSEEEKPEQNPSEDMEVDTEESASEDKESPCDEDISDEELSWIGVYFEIPVLRWLFLLYTIYVNKSYIFLIFYLKNVYSQFKDAVANTYSDIVLTFVIILFSVLLSYYVGNPVNCDAPRAWGLYFQDSASPQMEALVELHDNIMYYLVAILFIVGWIQGAIIKNFESSKSPISNKYLNHGRCVPIQKYSNYIQKKTLLYFFNS